MWHNYRKEKPNEDNKMEDADGARTETDVDEEEANSATAILSLQHS